MSLEETDPSSLGRCIARAELDRYPVVLHGGAGTKGWVVLVRETKTNIMGGIQEEGYYLELVVGTEDSRRMLDVLAMLVPGRTYICQVAESPELAATFMTALVAPFNDGLPARYILADPVTGRFVLNPEAPATPAELPATDPAI